MSLKNAAAKGVRWVGLSAGYRLLLMLLRMSILARLLSPREFGLMSMVTVVLTLAQTNVDMGLPTAIIQKQENDRRKLSTLYWMSMLASVLVCTVIIVLKQPLASFMREPALAELLPVMAMQLPVAAFSRQFLALFRREMEFKLVGSVQMVSATLAAAVAILFAFEDFGVWALVAANLFEAAFSSIWFVLAGARHWPLQLAFRYRDVAAHLRFGMYELGKANVAALATHVDTLLVGRYLGANDLGVYAIAKQLVNIPRNRINPVISQVTLSVFSKQQEHPERMAHALFTLQRAIAYVNLPYLCGLIAVAPLLVPVLYGDGWTDVVLLAQILAVPLLVLAVSGPTQMLRIALGQVAFNFHWAWITGIVQIVAVWYSVQHGLLVLAVVRSAVTLLLGILLLELTLRMLGKTTLAMLVNLKAPALAVTVMFMAVVLVCRLAAPLDDVVNLAVCIGTGMAVFGAMSLKLDHGFVHEHAKLLLSARR